MSIGDCVPNWTPLVKCAELATNVVLLDLAFVSERL